MVDKNIKFGTFLPFFSNGGSLAIKVDISKALTPWTGPFIIKVMKPFGFNDILWNWINLILHSAKLSINVNANLEGFFSCTMGVRQGDPLSPLLFCSAEEVLSRGITKLVFENSLQPMLGPSSLPMTYAFSFPLCWWYYDVLERYSF